MLHDLNEERKCDRTFSNRIQKNTKTKTTEGYDTNAMKAPILDQNSFYQSGSDTDLLISLILVQYTYYIITYGS